MATAEQIAQYAEQGFVVVPDVLSSEELTRYRTAVAAGMRTRKDRWAFSKLSSGGVGALGKGERQILTGQNILEYVGRFCRYQSADDASKGCRGRCIAASSPTPAPVSGPKLNKGAPDRFLNRFWGRDLVPAAIKRWLTGILRLRTKTSLSCRLEMSECSAPGYPLQTKDHRWTLAQWAMCQAATKAV